MSTDASRRHEDVFAAGDVARFPAAVLDKTMRVEHEDHAKSHGRLAGINMAGADEALRSPAVLLLRPVRPRLRGGRRARPRHETVAEWDEPNRKGIVYYLDAERHPRGVLLWNVFGRVDAARDLIRARQPIEASTLSEPVG